MGLFEPISIKENTEGLVFHKEIGNYLVELQTGLFTGILHLVIFDKDTFEVLADKVGAFQVGDTLSDNMKVLQAEIASLIATIQ